VVAAIAVSTEGVIGDPFKTNRCFAFGYFLPVNSKNAEAGMRQRLLGFPTNTLRSWEFRDTETLPENCGTVAEVPDSNYSERLRCRRWPIFLNSLGFLATPAEMMSIPKELSRG
jgi:hypothetical protein